MRVAQKGRMLGVSHHPHDNVVVTWADVGAVMLWG